MKEGSNTRLHKKKRSSNWVPPASHIHWGGFKKYIYRAMIMKVEIIKCLIRWLDHSLRMPEEDIPGKSKVKENPRKT